MECRSHIRWEVTWHFKRERGRMGRWWRIRRPFSIWTQWLWEDSSHTRADEVVQYYYRAESFGTAVSYHHHITYPFIQKHLRRTFIYICTVSCGNLGAGADAKKTKSTKQALALAFWRAFINSPSIILLDDLGNSTDLYFIR